MVTSKLTKFKSGYFFFPNEFRKLFSTFSRITIYNFSCAHECKFSHDVCAFVLNFYWDVYWCIFYYIFISLYDLDSVGLA